MNIFYLIVIVNISVKIIEIFIRMVKSLRSTRTSFVLISFTVIFQLTEGQVHYFILGHYPNMFPTLKNTTTNEDFRFNSSSTIHYNSTAPTTILQAPNESSQSTMDILTICWYVATFVALAAFFLLMLCSNHRRNTSSLNSSSPQDIQQALSLTPAPSYSQFAPPSYDTVIKEGIYFIPTHPAEEYTAGTLVTNVMAKNINFYTQNELNKLKGVNDSY